MPTIETSRAKILRRMTKDGWVFDRHGSGHDLYRHPAKPGKIILPRHRILPPGTARSISKAAGWD